MDGEQLFHSGFAKLEFALSRSTVVLCLPLILLKSAVASGISSSSKMVVLVIIVCHVSTWPAQSLLLQAHTDLPFWLRGNGVARRGFDQRTIWLFDVWIVGPSAATTQPHSFPHVQHSALVSCQATLRIDTGRDFHLPPRISFATPNIPHSSLAPRSIPTIPPVR